MQPAGHLAREGRLLHRPPPGDSHHLQRYRLTEHDGEVDIFTITGEFDLAVSMRLTPELNTLLRDPAPAVMIDLEAVTFMDASGIALLLNTYRRLDHAGHRLAIACPEGGSRRALELTGADRQLPLYPSRRAALDNLGSTCR